MLKNKDVTIRTFNDESGSMLIDSTYFIFPVIERMEDTPLGKYVLPALRYFSWLILLIAFIILLFPYIIKFPVTKWILTSKKGIPPQNQFVDGALEMIHPVMLKRVMNTLQEEVEIVKELDTSTIKKNSKHMVFYYGTFDGFCPQKFLFELRERVPEVRAFLCQERLPHVYVTHDSERMARIMKNVMESVKPSTRVIMQ